MLQTLSSPAMYMHCRAASIRINLKKGEIKAPKIEQMFVFIIRKCYTHVNAGDRWFTVGLRWSMCSAKFPAAFGHLLEYTIRAVASPLH